MIKIHKTCFNIAAEKALYHAHQNSPLEERKKEKHANAGTVQLCYISVIIIIVVMKIEKEESGIDKSRNLGLKTIVKLLLP